MAARLFGPCPKCEHTDIGVLYRADGGEYDCMFATPEHPKGEHFDINCQTCHFEWAEPLKLPVAVSR